MTKAFITIQVLLVQAVKVMLLSLIVVGLLMTKRIINWWLLIQISIRANHHTVMYLKEVQLDARFLKLKVELLWLNKFISYLPLESC